MVSARHEACGRKTRIRLPGSMPAGTVRRVLCQGCAQPFDASSVEEVELIEPAGYVPVAPSIDTLIWAAAQRVEPPAPVPTPTPTPKLAPPERPQPQRTRSSLAMPALAMPSFSMPSFSMPSVSLPSVSLPSFSKPTLTRPSFARPALSVPALTVPKWVRDPGSRTWRYLSIPIAALAVIAALLAIQGGGSDDSPTPFQAAAPPAGALEAGAPQAVAGAGKGAKGGSADLVRESSFSLALPDGWQRDTAAAGSTFYATSPGGDADATLWVERDPKLTFPSFEARSLGTLRSLAGSARVVERVAAPTADATVVRLAADAPEGSPQYEVTLRTSGPYRYYLATTVQPDAPGAAVDGAELIHGSFVPSGATQSTGSQG